MMSENQENKKNSSSGIPTIIKIAGIIGIIVFWYMVFYGPMPTGYLPHTKEGNYDIMVSDHVNISEIALDIQADVGSYDIKYLPQGSQNLLDADYDIDYRIPKNAEQDIIISISNTTVNETITISVFVDYPSNGNINIDNWIFTLYLNPDYAFYGLTADVAAGSLDIEANNITFNEFSVNTNAGEIDINLDSIKIESDFLVSSNAGEIDIILNNLIIDGDFSTSTNAGAIDIEFTEIQLINNTTMDISSDAGEIILSWTQTISLGADVTMYVNNDVGEIDIDIVATDLLMKYQVDLDTDIGSEDFNHDEWDVVSGYYQSPLFASSSVDTMQINAENDVGSLEIDIELQS